MYSDQGFEAKTPGVRSVLTHDSHSSSVLISVCYVLISVVCALCACSMWDVQTTTRTSGIEEAILSVLHSKRQWYVRHFPLPFLPSPLPTLPCSLPLPSLILPPSPQDVRRQWAPVRRLPLRRALPPRRRGPQRALQRPHPAQGLRPPFTAPALLLPLLPSRPPHPPLGRQGGGCGVGHVPPVCRPAGQLHLQPRHQVLHHRTVRGQHRNTISSHPPVT